MWISKFGNHHDSYSRRTTTLKHSVKFIDNTQLLFLSHTSILLLFFFYYLLKSSVDDLCFNLVMGSLVGFNTRSLKLKFFGLASFVTGEQNHIKFWCTGCLLYAEVCCLLEYTCSWYSTRLPRYYKSAK